MGFWKWVFRALLLLGSIAVATILGNGFVVSSLPMIIGYNIAGSLILGYSFYLVETKYLPRQRKKITNRLIALFDAKIVDESVIEFYLGGITFYAELNSALQMKEYGFFLQTLDFHIPRNQVDRPQERPGFLVEESSCNGVLTYIVLRSNGHGDLAVLKARLMNRFEGTP